MWFNVIEVVIYNVVDCYDCTVIFYLVNATIIYRHSSMTTGWYRNPNIKDCFARADLTVFKDDQTGWR